MEDHISAIENVLRGQIDEYKDELNSLRDSLSSSTKSSAGDKHETSRAHVQIELEQIGKQLKIKEEMLAELLKLPKERSAKKVSLGNIVDTSIGKICICVGLGNVEAFNLTAISIKAPLAQKLLNKRTGESIELNGRKVIINSIS